MLSWIALSLLLATPTLAAARAPVQDTAVLESEETALQRAAREARGRTAGPQDGLPVELFPVVRVVDGDTLHVQRGDTLEKLRILSVDTEEKIRGKGKFTGTKPETVFGTETSAWAEQYFAAHAGEDGTTLVGLSFPDGVEAYDVYGRLLCHVILADGTDFNLKLVELGKSPYFNKYGNSRICHDEFVAAQAAAREAGLGVWNPETNEPKTPGAPSAKRPYDELLPWWQARAEAVDAYRAARAESGVACAAADVPNELEAAAAHCAKKRRGGTTVQVFGSIDRVFEEQDGSQTLLFRTGRDLPALRVRIPAEQREACAALELEASREEFRQNYLWVTGALAAGKTERGGYEITVSDPAKITRAGPEPARAKAAAEAGSR